MMLNCFETILHINGVFIRLLNALGIFKRFRLLVKYIWITY